MEPRSPRWAFVTVISIIAASASSSSAAQVPCRVRDLQAGNDATCMVLEVPSGVVPAGAAMCFGDWSMLGANVTANSATPLPVARLSDRVATMKPGRMFQSCGVFVSPSGWRQLRCTRTNVYGTLGCGFINGNSGSNQLVPCDAVGLPTPDNSTQVKGVAPGSAYSHTTAWLEDGRVFAAGSSPGNGQASNIGVTANFTRVANLPDVVSCSAGVGFTCCLAKNNSVWCWGDNSFSQLGRPGASTFTPAQVAGISGDVVQLAAGGFHTLALLSNGTVVSWGGNTLGQLGDGSSTNSATPVLAANLTNVAQVIAGSYSSCGRLTNGDLRCWGDNSYGQLAANCSGKVEEVVVAPGLLFGCSTPQAPVPGVSGVASVTVGYSQVCVVLPNKTASCWGNGLNGQLSGDFSSASYPGRVVMCDAPNLDACVTSPCTATGGAVTCVDKPSDIDTTTNGRTCTCNNTGFVYSDPRGCYGCPASPPTGGTTSIASYQSCSSTLSANSYSLGTACTATCTAGSSGGFAKCGLEASGAPVWQVTPCTADCSSAGLPAVPSTVWSCGASVTAGGSCSGSCAAGFTGRLTAVCVGPSWSTSGNCTRVACIGPPPGGAPNATFQCASTPVGQPCIAGCTAGLTGSPRRVCLADGSWGALEGDACVNCAANQPQLTANQPSASIAAGSTVVSTEFTFTAPFIKGTTTLQAKLDGDPTTACTTQPAQLTRAFATPTAITVSCQVAAGISAGPHKISLKATTTGSNGCSSSETTTLADILATPAPTPAPSVQLAAVGAAPSACKAAAGQPSTASATFTFEVVPAATGTGGLVLKTEVAASAAGATCTTTRTGGLERGLLEVTCRGVFDSLTSLGITVTLKASTPGSLESSATSSQTVAFICCTAATTLAHAVNTDPASNCQTCGGSASAVDGVWLRGGVQAGVMRAGAISASTCSSAGSADVGTITAACDEQNSKLLRVTITNPAGSAATKIEFLARCNIDTVLPNMPSCLAEGPYQWRTVTRTRNSLNVTTGPSGERILSFGILQTSTQATCTCGTSFFAVKQTGTFSTGGPVSSSGSCTAAARVRVKAKTAKNKATAMLPGRHRF